mgnify:CR=1 FL=1
MSLSKLVFFCWIRGVEKEKNFSFKSIVKLFLLLFKISIRSSLLFTKISIFNIRYNLYFKYTVTSASTCVLSRRLLFHLLYFLSFVLIYQKKTPWCMITILWSQYVKSPNSIIRYYINSFLRCSITLFLYLSNRYCKGHYCLTTAYENNVIEYSCMQVL